MGNSYFRFAIELAPGRNPPRTRDRLGEDLRAWFVARGLGYGMGALGGNRYCYGEVGPDPPATEDDRRAMAEWLRGRRMCATVRLEAVVPFDPSADMLAPITDWVFEVDTLTEQERAEAAAYHADLYRRVEALRASGT
jgi:hypothetical protein